MIKHVAIGLIASLVLGEAMADTPPQAASPVQASAQAQNPATPPAPAKGLSLEASYKREYAFLQAEKAELHNRLYSFKAKAAAAEKALQQQTAALGQQNILLSAKEEAVREELTKVEQAGLAASENNDLLDMTYSQANTTLAGFQKSLEKDGQFLQAPHETKLGMLFAQGQALLRDVNSVNSREGLFFLRDGAEVKGQVVSIGNIAAYGISDKGSGLLVPAGDGRLKLWSEPAAETAQQIAAGQTVALQKIYIFENRVKAVEEKKEKTFMEEVEEGGEIAWILLGLGVLSIFLIVARIVLLWLAAQGKSALVGRAMTLLQHNRKSEALSYCEKNKSPFTRVLAAIIRNADANPEHMDDVISESLLHESSTLNRFGAAIVVIASVAPLIGLLGTVTGMIATFGLITEHGTGDPRLLSSGIAIALVTTELGLVVAIPSGLAGSLLGSWSEGIKSSLEEIALRASNLLLDREHSKPAAAHLDQKHHDAALNLALIKG
jgi:biopolymer transport protein ExbB